MINMELLNLIRRMSLRLKLPIREIARRTGLSRNTVKKHLNAGTVEPKFAISDRPSKLDPFAEKLAGWLKSEAGKSRKQRRTLKQLHTDLGVCQRSCPPISCGVSDFGGADFAFRVEPDGSCGLPVAGFA